MVHHRPRGPGAIPSVPRYLEHQVAQESIIADSKKPRRIGVMVGIAAAIGTVSFIVFRLIQAAAPVPTPVSLLNLTSVPVTVQELSVGGIGVMSGTLRTPLGASGASATYVPDATVNLAVGRILEVRARITGAESLVARCNPEPRPYGACSLKVAFRGTPELQCAFECKTERRE